MINKDLKVAVLGAGAMGCLFGGLLAEKGLNVILIDVWKEHIDAINKNGLKMDGHGGDRFIKVKATTMIIKICRLLKSESSKELLLIGKTKFFAYSYIS